MSSKFKLKFLNGILKDQEVPIPNGTLSLGTEGEIFVKFEKSETQFSLEVSEKGVLLSSFKDVWINGAPGLSWENFSENSEKILPLGVVLDLDGIGLVILNSETVSQEEFIIPVRKAASHDQRSLFNRLNKKFLSAFLIVACLGGVAYAGRSFYRLNHPVVTRDVMEEARDWIEEHRQSSTYQELAFSIQSNGEIVISGACFQASELSPLLEELKTKGWAVQNLVICNDELCKNVSYILSLFGFEQAVVTSGSELGTVDIAGAIKGGVKWQKVEKMLVTLPGLKRWSVLDNASEQAKILADLIGEQNFQAPLDVLQKKNKILLTGKLNLDEEKRLKDLLQGLEEKFPTNEYIYQNIDSQSEEVSIWPSPLMAVGGNETTPFLELQNGQRLQIGSRLPSGYQIIDINLHSGIRLLMEGKIINVPIDFS